jgi:cytochrome c biogenesis factor
MLKKYSHAVTIWIVTLRLPALLVPVVSLKRAIATGTLNALARAIGVAAITIIAIATMPSMSLLLDFDLAGVANSSSDLAPERL